MLRISQVSFYLIYPHSTHFGWFIANPTVLKLLQYFNPILSWSLTDLPEPRRCASYFGHWLCSILYHFLIVIFVSFVTPTPKCPKEPCPRVPYSVSWFQPCSPLQWAHPQACCSLWTEMHTSSSTFASCMLSNRSGIRVPLLEQSHLSPAIHSLGGIFWTNHCDSMM